MENRVRRLQLSNSELFLVTETVQGFATATSTDDLINRFMGFCFQLTGAQKILYSSNELSRKLEIGVYRELSSDTFNQIFRQTNFHKESVFEIKHNELGDYTVIILRQEPQIYLGIANLPLPDRTTEYIGVISKIASPFILALNEKEHSEKLKQSEKALRESEQRWVTTLSSIGDAVIATDINGNITFMNNIAEALTGWTLAEAAQKPLQEVFHIINEETRKEVENPVTLVLQSGGVVGLANNSVLVVRDGSEVPIDDSGSPIKDHKGRITGVVLVFHDITERKHVEQELDLYRKNLEKLVEERTRQLNDAERLAAIGATAGMVGHDIRNPLQAITSDVFLAKSDLASLPDTEEKKMALESLDEISNNVEYINKIVQDLQDFARPIRPATKETSLQVVFDEIIAKNQLPHNIRIKSEVPKEACIVLADPDFLRRIITNLVNNAIQAMPEGGELSISSFQDQKEVVVTVEDTGVGIPEEVRPKLFTPLFTTKSKGQGFGLAVVKRMTEAMGGSVTFESKVGKGTTFIVRFPRI